MANKIRTIHYGLGPIGCHIARVAARRSQIAIVGGVDIDPAKVGHDLGTVIGLEKPLGIAVERDLAAILKRTEADVVVHSTGSFLPQVRDQIEALVQAGLNMVSTCEELSYPWAAHPRIAADLDRLAKDKGVTILGTGVNPGFVMDTLALVLSGVCQDITHLRITRVVDTAQRRVQLQRKTGAGLPLDDFQRRVKAGTLRHVGLPESLHMVAAGLGWKLDEVEDTIEPIVAGAPARSADIVVEPGQAAGVRQVARGLKDGREVIALHLVMQLGAPESYDAVDIAGTPPVHMRIAGGVHGDQATAAIVVNAIPRVIAADPGLLTMADLPVVAAWLG